MRHSAFSLIELSIVLVILGLLTGGILAGKSLIRAAELNNNLDAIKETVVAIHSFQDRYFGLPGDLNNAQSFWSTQTVNGDGDGIIDFTNEYKRVFQQLALAGLAPGSYTGGNSMADCCRHTSAGTYIMVNHKNTPVYGVIGHTIRLMNDGGNGILNEPQTAWQMDTKIDDGNPGTGRMLSQNDAGGAGCVVTSGGAVAYDLAGNALLCNVRYYVNGDGR
jgi:prepilin-type N-terminal cleavage/methylation domain-containing protein